jgi:hypothetical protein
MFSHLPPRESCCSRCWAKGIVAAATRKAPLLHGRCYRCCLCCCLWRCHGHRDRGSATAAAQTPHILLLQPKQALSLSQPLPLRGHKGPVIAIIAGRKVLHLLRRKRLCCVKSATVSKALLREMFCRCKNSTAAVWRQRYCVERNTAV